jgi:hypothetical protein
MESDICFGAIADYLHDPDRPTGYAMPAIAGAHRSIGIVRCKLRHTGMPMTGVTCVQLYPVVRWLASNDRSVYDDKAI